MSKQKKTSVPKPHVIRMPLPPQRRQQASAPPATAGRRKKFVDVPAVQQPLFDLNQGGAR
jgi:hypothetical protein